jgi:hypothetical protein
VLQNEYSVWVVKDKHAKAFDSLSLPIAVRMAKILGYTEPANKVQRCLDCHATSVPEAEQAKTYKESDALRDGVGCESCHGPASKWLGPHTTENWPHDQSVRDGMIDLTDLSKRTDQCLTCHLGTDKKVVDHELIAAGHPDLYFELASFSAVMPRHWTPRSDIDPAKNKRNTKDAWYEVHELAIGQATQLRAQMDRIVREATSNSPEHAWPEYAEMDCFACHHSLPATKDSWRQDVLLKHTSFKDGREATERTGGFNHTPGNPPYNMSRYVILRKVAAMVDPGTAQQLDGAMAQVYRSVTSIRGDNRGASAAAARSAGDIAKGLIAKAAAIQPTPQMTVELMKAILSEGEFIADQGERAAEQAAMALDALWAAYKRNTNDGKAERVQNAIHDLFKQVEEPSGYNAPKFAAQLRVVAGML